MKIRNGFVSNSSSSSFIISNNHFKSVRDLAKYMIKRQIDEIKFEDKNDWNKEYIKYKKDYIKRLNNIDENHPVSFPSCNYDTYIRKVGDVYLVATCNNTDWELYDYVTKMSDSDENELIYLKSYYPGEENDIDRILEDNYDFSPFGKDFYSLDKEIIGIETYNYCSSTKHEPYTRMWDTKYGEICLICNPIFKRKKKLEIIDKVSKDEN